MERREETVRSLFNSTAQATDNGSQVSRKK
jgi:hypothetical protein